MAQSWHPRELIASLIPPRPLTMQPPATGELAVSDDSDTLRDEVMFLREVIAQLHAKIARQNEQHEAALAAERAKRERATDAYRLALAGMRRSFSDQIAAVRPDSVPPPQ